MRKAPLAAALVGMLTFAGLAAGGVAAWRTRNHTAQVASPIASPEYLVRTADDPGEANNLRAVDELLRQLPELLSRNDQSWLSSELRGRMADVAASLRTGSTLTMDPASWRRTGAVASVSVTVTGADNGKTRYVLVLVYENQLWKVNNTFPAGD